MSDPHTRDDDRLLIWSFWESESGHDLSSISYNQFKDLTSTETIRRSRQKVQQLNPQLKPSPVVEHLRKEKEKEKGFFIYK